MLELYNVSPEILLQIFDFCNLETLKNLRLTCKKFNEMVKKSISFYKYAIVTNQVKRTFIDRCHILLEPEEKWRVSANWRIGSYKKVLLLKRNIKYMPWLNLKNISVWISEGEYIKSYKRHKKSFINLTPSLKLNGESNQDIVRFVNKNNYILAGQRSGGLWLYSITENKILFNNSKAHDSDIHSVDLNDNIFISGSRDGEFKIWPHIKNPKALKNINIGDKIWSLGISPKGTKTAIGTAGYEKTTTCHIYDLKRDKIIRSFGEQFKKGSGILDMHWEDENILLTCGYDTYLRKWDLRVDRCVQSWVDPQDGTYYCLSSDDMYSVMCGCNLYGRIIHWDQRCTDYIQLYYTQRNTRNQSSPVYSMSFDSQQLFAALDTGLACLDFSVNHRSFFNYSNNYEIEYKFIFNSLS